MDRDFLTGLGIDEENADAILQEHTKELGILNLNHTVESELIKRGAKSVSAAMKLFDTDGLTYTQGQVEGLYEKLDEFEEQNDFLFDEKVKKPVFSKKLTANTAITKSEFEKMGYEKRLKLFKESPELYKKLTNN